MNKLTIGVIGLGRMGKKHLAALVESGAWEVKYVCDIDVRRRAEALAICPTALFTMDEDEIFLDPTVSVVAMCALADGRSERITKAVRYGKHIFAEKPLASDVLLEEKVVDLVEHSGLVSTVNLSLRNAWFANEMKAFIHSGEIGTLAIVRLCQMTPGLAPGEGHAAEGPSFHDCGMHYVDMARWFAESEFKTAHAQAIRMWSYKDPWWLQCHGTFDNGVVYDITQGHVYGQLAKDQTHNAYFDLIGTKGIVRMSHDFQTAVVEKHGVTITDVVRRPHGDKNIGRMYELLYAAIHDGAAVALPTFRDAFIASKFAWAMLRDAATHEMPCVGTLNELEQIRQRRATMTNGYGLLR